MPYSLSDLNLHLNELRSLQAPFLKLSNIGKSIGGLNIPIVKVTSVGDTVKPVIMIMGRQHSGETHSSFIIHGLINFLVSRDRKAIELRNYFEWWILPIVNPDGVVIGNYRTNLQGKDMNRHFFQETERGEDGLKQEKCSEVELIRDYMKEHLKNKR